MCLTMSNVYNDFIYQTVKNHSPMTAMILKKETDRQDNAIELIASENYPSEAVMAACGSIMMCKYTEGYSPNKALGRKARYYGGCENFDAIEDYGIKVFQRLFDTDYYFNLQPHSGSNANFIAYASVLNIGDSLLSMSMDAGAHLTHSSPVSFVSKMYNVCTYGVNKKGFLDYDKIEQTAKDIRPKAIMCGASAYPRKIDFAKLREIADSINAYLIADVAHISTLCASGEHISPFGYAHIITFTTQKIFRGPRGGIIACVPELAKKVDSACFPFAQGGSLQNAILGKVIAAEEACKPEYKEYIHQVVRNSKAMCDEFIRLGYDIVTGGTENHLFMIDFSKTHPNLTGKMVQDELDKHGITLNKNCVPGEKRSPTEASGVRIGTAAMTTKGFTEKDFVKTAQEIDKIIRNMENED